MYLYNKERSITNNQIYEILKLYSDEEIIDNLFIFDKFYETIRESFMNSLNKIDILGCIPYENFCKVVLEDIKEEQEDIDRVYSFPSLIEKNYVVINLFMVEKKKYDKQLYGIGILIENLYKLQHRNKTIEECNKFAIDFVNNHLGEIKEIMNWKEEYEIVDF